MDTSTYKIVVKVAGQLSSTCNANEVNAIGVQIGGGYPTALELIPVTAPVGGGSAPYRVSTQYF